MTAFYSICAVLGCTILVCQSVLTVLGLSHFDVEHDGDVGDGQDVDHEVEDNGGDDGVGETLDHAAGHDAAHHHSQAHHGSSWFFGVVTMRTVTAALAFFGLTGLAVTASGGEASSSLTAALGAGVAALFFVHWMMKSLAHLKAEGTVRIERAVGAVGNVYIKIPARKAGFGKVQIELQGRTVELAAQTEQDELPTGATIVVTKVLGSDAVEVARAA